MDYNKMSLEALEHRQQELNAKRAELKEQAQAVQRVMDQKIAEAALQHRVATMSDAEKATLAQLVRAGGLDTDGAVGVPGR